MSVEIKVKVTDYGKAYQKTLQELSRLEVVAGYQEDAPYPSGGQSLLDVVIWNEYGTEKIPSRPFIRNSVESYIKEIDGFFQRDIKRRVIAAAPARQLLARIGEYQVTLIRRSIKEGSYVPNSPATVARKKSDKPLIDTGHMRQSIHYQVREK